MDMTLDDSRNHFRGVVQRAKSALATLADETTKKSPFGAEPRPCTAGTR